MKTFFIIIFSIIAFSSVSLSINIQQHIQINNEEVSISPITNFSLSTAFEHLMYSYSSYCSIPELSNWTCPYCTYNGYLTTSLNITQYLINNTTNTFGYIGVTSDQQTIVIAFRGTQLASLENWITNLNFPKSQPYPAFSGAEVHSGFYEAYTSIASQLKIGIMSAQKQCPFCSRLIVTGHSLGGALAILAATDIYESGYTELPVEMYTFGSPRVGNIGFVEYFEQMGLPSIHRLVHYRDIVPHLPPLMADFYHLPIEVWFYNATSPLEYRICNSSGEDPSCSDIDTVDLSIVDHLDYLGIDKILC